MCLTLSIQQFGLVPLVGMHQAQRFGKETYPSSPPLPYPPLPDGRSPPADGRDAGLQGRQGGQLAATTKHVEQYSTARLVWLPGGLLESCWDNIGRKVEELLEVVNSLVGEVIVVPVPVEALGDEAVSKSTRSTTSRHE